MDFEYLCDTYKDARTFVTIYDAPVDEFSIVWTKLGATKAEKQDPIDGPSLIIVTSGSGDLSPDTEFGFNLQEGYIYFIGAGTPINVQSGDFGLQFYRAFATA